MDVVPSGAQITGVILALVFCLLLIIYHRYSVRIKEDKANEEREKEMRIKLEELLDKKLAHAVIREEMSDFGYDLSKVKIISFAHEYGKRKEQAGVKRNSGSLIAFKREIRDHVQKLSAN